MFPTHWTVVCWSEEIREEHSAVAASLEQPREVSWGKLPSSCRGEQRPHQGLQGAPFQPSRVQSSWERGSDSKYLSELLLGFVGRMVGIFHSGLRKGIPVLGPAALQSCAKAQLIQWTVYPGQQAGQQVSAVACWACSSCACSFAEELACASHKHPARTQLPPLLQHFLWPGHVLPSGDEGLPFPKACPAVSSSEPIRAWCHLSFRLALYSQEYQREGEVCPSVNSCSCQGCLWALAIWIQTQPAQLLLQPDEGQAPRLLSPAAPRAQRCTAQPQPFPATPPASPPLIRKAFHRQGGFTCKERNEAGPWTAWRMKAAAEGEAVWWGGLLSTQIWRARACQEAALELVRQECKSWLPCKVA